MSKTENKEMSHIKKAVPGHGEGSGEAVGRGKCEQKRKSGSLAIAKSHKSFSLYSHLYSFHHSRMTASAIDRTEKTYKASVSRNTK